MTNLRDFLEKIIDNYQQQQTMEFKSNFMADYIRNKFINVEGITNYVESKGYKTHGKTKDSEGYSIYGSSGIGQWAEIPWVGLFNNYISNSAQKGIYIVYLFSPEDGNIYLSLNQGWKSFKDKYKKDAKKMIHKKSQLYRGLLKYTNSNINDDPFDFGLKKDNPIGYQLGNIICVKYNKFDLPENEVMLKDLQDMIDIYEDLVDQIDIDKNENTEIKKDILEEEKYNQNIKYKISYINKLNLTEENRPSKSENNKKEKANKERKGIKKDYKKSNEKNTALGSYGEQIILYNEKRKLEKIGLNKEVEWVSKNTGDGIGYDIKSYDEKGNEIYIEVKTTTQSKNSSFFISSNEIDFSEQYSESYKLYRLYELDIDNKDNDEVRYYVIDGNLKNELNLIPNSYTATN